METEIQKPGIARILGPVSETNLVQDAAAIELPNDHDTLNQHERELNESHARAAQAVAQKRAEINERNTPYNQAVSRMRGLLERMVHGASQRKFLSEFRPEVYQNFVGQIGTELVSGRQLAFSTYSRDLSAVDFAISECDKWLADRKKEYAEIESEVRALAKQLNLPLPAELAEK